MGRINVTSRIFEGLSGPNQCCEEDTDMALNEQRMPNSNAEILITLCRAVRK